MAAAAVIITACVLPFVRWRDGTASSAWNDWGAGYVLEPLAVAILGFVAGIMLVSGRRPGHRWVAAGMLLASGTQTFLLFWGVQSAVYTPGHAASAGLVGMTGGLMLVAAGALGAGGNAAGRAAPDLAAASAIGDSPTAG